MKMPPKMTPAHKRQRHAGDQFSVGRRGVGGHGFAMNGVMENDRRHEERPF